MSRTTIDYGIDLGTTNSSIALVTGTETEVIKNSLEAEITPSAVHISREGNLCVGQNARSKMADERAEDDVFLEFKRRMGTGFEYTFRASGRRMSPEQLSAEVLKSLRSDVARKKGEEIAAAVITVPAAFELHQCDATRRAAELAGFRTSLLLQEPVAAALAYGHQKLDARAYWLVFDFGGGTFDAALIRSEDGTMVVANHGGDNLLGGSDIDWAIVEQLLIPRVKAQFGWRDLARGSAPFKYDLLRLKAAAETAKIELSHQESTVLEATLRRGAGEPVLFETTLTREEVGRVAEPSIMKAVTIAQRVLGEKGVGPSAVEKMVFVGAPTIAPYFRELVKERLQIPFDVGVDPITVVARGAAIFAGSQRAAPRTASSPSTRALLCVELIYKPVGADPEPLIGGKVSAPPGAALADYTIEVVNQQSKWRSGKAALTGNGAFQFAVRAEREIQNTFRIEVRDPAGDLCLTVPDRFHYTIGVIVEEQPIINNLGVAMSDNEVGLHFTKGQGLPAKHARSYRTTVGLRKGESGSVVKIPIVEGNRELADRNILIGTLEITPDKIDRDLPAGSEIEVTLRMDTSRLLTVAAYVPLLDEEFPAKIALGGKVRQPEIGMLRQEWNRELARLADLKQGLEEAGEHRAVEILRQLETSGMTRNLERRFTGDGADFDALLKADRELIEFKVALDEIAAQVAWPACVREAENWLGDLDRLVGQDGTGEEKARAQMLREQVRAIVAEKKEDRLRKKIDELSDVYATILYRRPAYWIEYFESLGCSRLLMRDQAKSGALLQEGRACVAANDLAGLKNVVFHLQNLLPGKVAGPARRGYGSGLAE
jgi:molecular chaperone DnaK